jgi:hypothetical protein
MNQIYKTVDERQRYVQKSGRAWEDFVLHEVNNGLKKINSSLVVIRGDSIKEGTPIWNTLSIPVGKHGSTQRIWGDIDLVVINESRDPVAIISCKTSLHGRFSETLFYAVVLKDIDKNLRVVFATPDKGRQQKGTVWQSEWGSEEKPTKDRQLGSYYLDGVYIFNKKTKLGGMIRPLTQLAGDVSVWAKQSRQAME